MARRLPWGPEHGYRTSDHSEEIVLLRLPVEGESLIEAITREHAADLLEAHDDTGISLDEWFPARILVELILGKEIIENGV